MVSDPLIGTQYAGTRPSVDRLHGRPYGAGAEPVQRLPAGQSSDASHSNRL